MSVLIEATRVVIQVDTIDRQLVGPAAFAENASIRTFRSYGRLAAIGFMNPDDVEVFILGLEKGGLTYARGGASIGIVVVDQFHGFALPCTWLSLGVDSVGVKFAALVGEPAGRTAAYPGWRPGSKREVRGAGDAPALNLSGRRNVGCAGSVVEPCLVAEVGHY